MLIFNANELCVGNNLKIHLFLIKDTCEKNDIEAYIRTPILTCDGLKYTMEDMDL